MQITNPHTLLALLDAHRKQIPLSRKKWLRAAGVAESTFYRWQARLSEPRYATLERLREALAR